MMMHRTIIAPASSVTCHSKYETAKQSRGSRVRVAPPELKHYLYLCLLIPSQGSHRWSIPLLAYKREKLASGQEGSKGESYRCNRMPSDGCEPTRTNRRRSTEEDQEAGAPPRQHLARTPPRSF
jgi:hypothetical protein